MVGPPNVQGPTEDERSKVRPNHETMMTFCSVFRCLQFSHHDKFLLIDQSIIPRQCRQTNHSYRTLPIRVWLGLTFDLILASYRIKSHNYFVVGPNFRRSVLSWTLEVGRPNHARMTSFPKEFFVCLFYLGMMA